MMEWWATGEYDINAIENEDSHVVVMAARQNEAGDWEYAIVRWRYLLPTLMRLYCDGKLIASEDEE